MARKKKEIMNVGVQSYEDVVRQDVLNGLGASIFTFRNISNILVADVVEELTKEELVDNLNNVYQTAFSSVLDKLSDAHEMKMIDTAMDAIKETLLIERGFKKFSKYETED